MNFKIILKLSDIETINWGLNSQYSLEFRIPLFYSSIEKNIEIDVDLIRREGAAIHSFLLTLNKGYNKKEKFKQISICYDDTYKHKNKRILDIFSEGFVLANYEFSNYKTNYKSNLFKIDSDLSNLSQCSISGTYIARDLVNQPLSHLNAEKLSIEIKKIGKKSGFKVEVLKEDMIKKLKMGGILSVNKGSVAKPTFNILTYKSKKSKEKHPIVLVGKGVMYDTGGLSLKPTLNSMDMMKCDMAGAATVIGSISALAAAKTNCYVVGLIPAVENRPAGDAYVPGDVIKMMSGVTVEVLNTDAEGRLILADALHYAKRYKPSLVIDVATLTGAAARTLGKQGIVAMENYKKTIFSHYSSKMKSLMDIGDALGERVVPQPFWDDYKDELKSAIADIKNLGGIDSGHITAGKFLEYFVDYPWIHLDIAGLAFLQNDYLYHKKGGTGIGVRLLTNFIYNY